jgi:hypothetical protein
LGKGVKEGRGAITELLVFIYGFLDADLEAFSVLGLELIFNDVVGHVCWEL